MTTFIRAVEVWTPSSDGTLLESAGGLYGAASHFAMVSRAMCFGRGEGLPGRAWDEGRPLVLRQFEGSYFLRTVAARAAGIVCAVALPVFVQDQLRGVVVFFCGDDSLGRGAIELWRNDPRVTGDMTLVDGCYGSAAQDFEALSRDTYLPRGSGLPGLAWQRGAAVLVDDLGDTRRFLRAEASAAAGIERGLALPCSTPGNEAYVMTFLSAAEAPVALRIESWVPAADGSALVRNFGHCERQGPLSADARLALAGAEGLGGGSIARAFASGVPAVSSQAAGEPDGIGAACAAHGLQSLLAIPIVDEGRVAEVAVLYF